MKREEQRLSLPEAADALGIAEITARRWIKSGKLRASQPGRNYQVPESAVEELLEPDRPKAGASGMPGLPEEGTPGRALLEAARELEERAGETAASVTEVSELLPWAEGLFGSITTLVRVAHELGVGDESEQIWQPNVLRVLALTKLKRDEILSADDQAERLEINRKFEEIVGRVPA